jgi:PTH1 family peptidyl-tRNA hydrolase
MRSHFPRTLVSRIASLANTSKERPSSSLDLFVVGLGNPGREYERTRHNVGWLVLDELARRLDGSWRSKFSGQLAEVRLDGAKLALLKPETFMNDSGRSVGAAARFFKVEPESLLIVHDDVDLAPGRLQARAGGGLAGHNGLRSLARTLGTQDFLRLRIGVGRPGRGDRRSVADYVLAAFAPEDDLAALVGRSADAVETLAREGLEATQQRFN